MIRKLSLEDIPESGRAEASEFPSGKGKAGALPARLRQAMKKEGLTIPQLAERAAMSTSGLNKWLAGTTTPGADKLGGVADVLHVTVDWLLGVTDHLPDVVVRDASGVVTQYQVKMSPPDQLFGSVKLDRLEEAFREAATMRGISLSYLRDTNALMTLTVLLYDARTKAADSQLSEGTGDQTVKAE